jgi:hypothetical protein
MIVRRVVVLSLVLALAFAAAVGVLRARPVTDADSLSALFTPCPVPDPAPCIFGLQPGVSTLAEVERFLRTSQAVSSYSSGGEGFIRGTGTFDVEWSGAVGGVSPHHPAHLGLDSGTLRLIVLTLETPLHTVGLALPNAERLAVQRIDRTYYAVTLGYFDGALVVGASGLCPLRLDHLWDAPLLTLIRRESRAPGRPPMPSDEFWQLCPS